MNKIEFDPSKVYKAMKPVIDRASHMDADEIGDVQRDLEDIARAQHEITSEAYLDAIFKLEGKLKLANEIIAQLDPDDSFVFEDGSEELEEEIRDYIKTHLSSWTYVLNDVGYEAIIQQLKTKDDLSASNAIGNKSARSYWSEKAEEACDRKGTDCSIESSTANGHLFYIYLSARHFDKVFTKELK